MTFNEERIAQVKEIIAQPKKGVIIAHKSPDGDSIGSSVGLYHYLVKKGIDVTICHPDPAPYFLDWMKGTDAVNNAEEHKGKVFSLIKEADFIFCLDFNTMSRTGMLKEALLGAIGKKIMIDHHLNPNEDEFDMVFSEPTSCSTAQLIADFIDAMGDNDLLDRNIGEALYCGIMTDTGSFRFPSVTAHTHEVIARLIQHGVEPYVIHESVFDTNTFDKLRLRSYAINEKMEIIEESNTALIYLSAGDLDRFNYVKGDTEGLVNVGLSIVGVKKSILLMEKDGIIKISFRSKGKDNAVNEMASTYFGGGGHANASGGKWDGSLEEAVTKMKNVLPEYDN